MEEDKGGVLIFEAETSGKLPSTIYAIKTVQMDRSGKRTTLIELFSHKSSADYYAARGVEMMQRGVKVQFYSGEVKWEEAGVE